MTLAYNVTSDVYLNMWNQYTCQQHIKWECKSSSIRKPGTSDPDEASTHMTYWKNNDDEMFAFKCLCRATNTCADGLACNCDKDDNEWRSDEMILTSLDSPMQKFFAGDTDAGISITKIHISVKAIL